jgi:O-antigen/teichoic acid export membrane protein
MTNQSIPFSLRIKNLVFTRSSSLFVALMIGNVIAYFYQMAMARLMIPAEYGVVVTLTSVSYLLDVVSRTIQTSVTKTTASLNEVNSKRSRPIFIATLRTTVPIAILIIAGIWISSGWLAKFLKIDSNLPIILLGLYASLHFLAPVPRGILLGFNRINEAGFTIIIEPIARLAIGVLLIIWGWKVSGAITGYIIGGTLAFMAGVIPIRKLLAFKGAPATSRLTTSGHERYAAIVFVMNLCLMVIASIDQIVVKHYFSPEIAGNYAVTFVIGRVIVMTAISLGIVIFTRSATMEMNDPKRVQPFMKSILLMVAISLLTIAATWIAPGIIIHLQAGSQYGLAQSYLRLIAVEMLFFGLVYVQTYYHISIGEMRGLWLLLAATGLEIAFLAIFHSSVQQVLWILISIMAGLMVGVTALSWRSFYRNRKSFVFIPLEQENENKFDSELF